MDFYFTKHLAPRFIQTAYVLAWLAGILGLVVGGGLFLAALDGGFGWPLFMAAGFVTATTSVFFVIGVRIAAEFLQAYFRLAADTHYIRQRAEVGSLALSAAQPAAPGHQRPLTGVSQPPQEQHDRFWGQPPGAPPSSAHPRALFAHEIFDLPPQA